ncbi:MAG TPA: metallophosphoesterase family protein [Terriglobales bacterium]|nr:metallophosphoesterase family protein [Terriglobales bacterium]
MRVLLLSDIHSNVEALEACLVAAPSYDLVVNLGDIVGYGASPNEAIERSRSLGNLCVRGNHDKASAGLMDLSDFNPIAGLAAIWTREHLTPDNLEWLKSLPPGPIQSEKIPGAQFVHGSPVHEDEYLVTLRDAIEPMLVSSVPVTFFGHSHLQGCFSATNVTSDSYRPTYQSVGRAEISQLQLKSGVRYMVNPGSVGQPRDGDWRAAFAVFDSESHIVTFCRTPYNLKAAQDRILAANLPQRLATRLAAGR